MKNLQKISEPWTHWIVDEFLEPRALTELKFIEHSSPQGTYGKRIGNDRLFITKNDENSFPNLTKVYKSLAYGGLRFLFEGHTRQSFKDKYLRVEVISDIGQFYLEPHPDVPEKLFSALVYTDSGKNYPGTTIYNGTEKAYTIDAIDNRCMFFVPGTNTMHGYEEHIFESPRRCLLINYWSYGPEEQKLR